MLDNTIKLIVKSVTDSIKFEKVSELTKEQFSEIISKSIYDSITDRDFMDKISNELAMRTMRRR